MMDDLVKRLASWGTAAGLGTHFLGTKSAREDCAEAAATIARQQVMLDRALEDAGDKMVEIARLRIALEDIIVASNNSGLEMGTVGMRVAERVEDIARAALEAKHG